MASYPSSASVVHLNAAWTDLFSDFMSYTESNITAPIHRMWSAIGLIAGACERRIWAKVGHKKTFPNLYILLVAPPGTGKFIIEDVKDLWSSTKENPTSSAFHVAPDSVTRASLVDELVKSSTIFHHRNALVTYTYHTLLIPAEEFEVILPAYDSSLISLLNTAWNNKAEHRETRRHGPVPELTITHPQITLLGGAQPAYFTSHFPETAWSTGLARRLILVYADAPPLMDPFLEVPLRLDIRSAMLNRLMNIRSLYGEVLWTPEAQTFVTSWCLGGGEPKPDHPRLSRGYNNTRTEHLIKLALISSISRTGLLNPIEIIDVRRGLAWLLEAEKYMPDIFRAMMGKSDIEVIEELHLFATKVWAHDKRGLTTDILMKFLINRVPADKASHILQAIERSRLIVRTDPSSDVWMPRPTSHIPGVH